MAPVYDFRHVELDKIGRGKRIVKPPGGECSDIFGVNGAGEPSAQSTPRKTHNYMQSKIFTEDGCSPTNGQNSPSKKSGHTQERLFGSVSEDETTPKKVVDRLKSRIFEEEVDSGIYSPKSTPVRRPSINPITGTPMGENGYTNGHGTNDHHSNGMNGSSTPESPTNGSAVQRVRVPPGGPSSGIF